jgi:rubrerythrin
MDNIKKRLSILYKVEMLGAAYYKALSEQYKNNTQVSGRLSDFAKHESNHGRMFAEAHMKLYGKAPGGEKFWPGLGKLLAIIFRLQPLRAKLKRLGRIEYMAVKQIEKELSSGKDNPYLEIARKILPDEKEHAAFYREWTGLIKK